MSKKKQCVNRVFLRSKTLSCCLFVRNRCPIISPIRTELWIFGEFSWLQKNGSLLLMLSPKQRIQSILTLGPKLRENQIQINTYTRTLDR